MAKHDPSRTARIAVLTLFGIDPGAVRPGDFGPHGVQVVNDPPQSLDGYQGTKAWTDYDQGGKPMVFVPWPTEVWRSRAVDALRADGVWVTPERTAFGVERIRDLLHQVQVDTGERPGSNTPLTDEGWLNILNRVADEAAERAVRRIRREDELAAARASVLASEGAARLDGAS